MGKVWVVVVGYANERDREMRQSRKVETTVEIAEELESAEKGLDESLWLAYETGKGKLFASMKDARTYLHRGR